MNLSPMLILITWSFRSRDQLSLMKFCSWEVILTPGTLDLKLAPMMTEEDLLLAMKP